MLNHRPFASLTLVAALVTSCLSAGGDKGPSSKEVLNRISEDSLRAHVSFLASDALEGRGTPSRGLNIAAEYIASQFRRAGLKPGVGDSYFQSTTYKGRRSETAETVSNVVGILPGTDPVLKDEYVLVTAHYDHLGIRGTAPGDIIFNGANDDGSGTASVVEVANALRGFQPKRSIVFMTFWGEEAGMLGSTYYGKNPVVPIAKTIAMLNLEQVGRTDDLEGARVGAVSITGYDYTDVAKVLKAAGKESKIDVQGHPQYSDAFFVRSDNASLALQGVPAHTICTAFEYPDYHKASDHWDKLDYANMAKVNRMIALSAIMMANTKEAPKWNSDNPKTASFIKAWKAHHGQ